MIQQIRITDILAIVDFKNKYFNIKGTVPTIFLFHKEIRLIYTQK